MQNAYSKVLLGGALLCFSLSLQGCGKAPVCEEGSVSTKGTVNGKITQSMVLLSTITCNTGTTYQGPEIFCTPDLTKVCAKSDVSMTNCTTVAGFWKADAKAPDAVMVPDGTDLAAQAKVTAAKVAVSLSEDKEVVCTPWPADVFKKFAELTPDQQKAAKGLGYNEKSWAANEDVDLSSKKWATLTPAQQKDATTLGFTQITWDWDPKPLDPTGKKADTASVTDKGKDGNAVSTTSTSLFMLKGVEVALGSITPMDVSMVLAMCLVLAVSIRAVTRRRKQRTLNSFHQEDPELLQGHLSDSERDIPE